MTDEGYSSAWTETPLEKLERHRLEALRANKRDPFAGGIGIGLPKKKKEAKKKESEADLRKVICQHCGNETGETSVDPLGTCEGCKVLDDIGIGVREPRPLRGAYGDDAESYEAEEEEEVQEDDGDYFELEEPEPEPRSADE